MQPWIFAPNAWINIWLNQLVIPVNPPTYAALKCQQMKPYYPYAQNVKGIAIHRFIIDVAASQIYTSTDCANGIVVALVDVFGNFYQYYEIEDVSPFFFDNGGGVNPTCNFEMLVGRICNF